MFDKNTVDSVLLVCMGNICRSPTAEAVLRYKAQEKGINLRIDSAGTLGAHAKEKPDHRAQKAGIARGYSFDNIKARKVTDKDFDSFDLILAMDKDNVSELKSVCPPHLSSKIRLLLEFSEKFDDIEVPDPYYGGAGGFRLVLDLVEDACEGLLAKIG